MSDAESSSNSLAGGLGTGFGTAPVTRAVSDSADRLGDDLRVGCVRELNGGSEMRNPRRAEVARWFLTAVKRP
jgi:hypothetical protein